MVEKFCAWCDQKMGPDGEPIPGKIPKAMQAGTHGTCNQCLKAQLAAAAQPSKTYNIVPRKQEATFREFINLTSSIAFRKI
jgi:hypothetical protein